MLQWHIAPEARPHAAHRRMRQIVIRAISRASSDIMRAWFARQGTIFAGYLYPRRIVQVTRPQYDTQANQYHQTNQKRKSVPARPLIERLHPPRIDTGKP